MISALTAAMVLFSTYPGVPGAVIPITHSISSMHFTETELQQKKLLRIQPEQETRWRDYVVARREYEDLVRYDKRRRLESLVSDQSEFGLDSNSDSLNAHRNALREKYEKLFVMFDNNQKTIADKKLSPRECGK